MIRRVPRPAAGCAILCLSLALSACGPADRSAEPSSAGGPTGAPAAALAEPDQVYTVRGQIRDLPDPARPASSFQVRHEAIDDFVHANGEVKGMDAMVMPFTPARDLSLEEFEIGDIVELVFEVRWKTQPRSRVVEMRKLPPDTKLEFREARPPAAPSPG